MSAARDFYAVKAEEIQPGDKLCTADGLAGLSVRTVRQRHLLVTVTTQLKYSNRDVPLPLYFRSGDLVGVERG